MHSPALLERIYDATILRAWRWYRGCLRRPILTDSEDVWWKKEGERVANQHGYGFRK